jgi:hypothetical protein
MTKPMVRIHNSETDEIIDREMTDAEFAQWQKDQTEVAKIQAEVKSREELKSSAEAKLAKLGLTSDEIAALL